jgi:hypothetical protein
VETVRVRLIARIRLRSTFRAYNQHPGVDSVVSRHRFARAVFGSVILTTLWGGTLVSAAPLHAADSSTLESSAVRFKQFVLQKIAQCQRATKNMRERIAAHDLHGAQQAWLTARSGWESSDVITGEFFPDLARKIDARSDDQRGFHAIEAKLFGAHDVRTLPAAELRGNVASIAAAYEQVFARAIKKRDAGLAKIFSLDLEETRALLSVRSLKKLDRARLRNLSAWLASDLVLAGQEIGLEKPDLATE